MELQLNFNTEVIPLLILTICIAIWINSSKNDENLDAKKIISKINMFLEGIFFMILSKDSKGLGPSKNLDPDSYKVYEIFIHHIYFIFLNCIFKHLASTSKRIIFIRHGESDWNDVFNKGFGPSFIFRLVGAIWRETLLMITNDSGKIKINIIAIILSTTFDCYIYPIVFFDSPLNLEGIEQVLLMIIDLNLHISISPSIIC